MALGFQMARGNSDPTPAQARLILDLDHVVARACCIFAPVVAREWWYGHDSYLGGARPIDVLRLRGVSEVLDALDAAEQMAFG